MERTTPLAMVVLVLAASTSWGAVPRMTPTDPPSPTTSSSEVSLQDRPLEVIDVHGRSLGMPIGQHPESWPINSDLFTGSHPAVVARRVSGTTVGLNIVRQGFVSAQPPPSESGFGWLTPYFLHESATCSDTRYLIVKDASIRFAQVLGRDLTPYYPAPGPARTGYYPGNPVLIHTFVAYEIVYDPALFDCTAGGGTPTAPGFCCYPAFIPFDAEAGPALSFDLQAFEPPFEVR